MMLRTFGVLLGGLLLAGAAHADQASQIQADSAWIRVLPAGLPAGGYVTLHNGGDSVATLTAVTSKRYAQAMLHQSTTAGGMGRMVMVDTLDIPAHGDVSLAPGGYHLMLMQATTPVQAGDSVPLVLRFADGSTLTVDFLARPANATDAGTDAMPMNHAATMQHAH